jgi:PAS domain S-box-containing protein
VSRSSPDLAGVNVSAEDFLAAVLETAAQPIWVVDSEGVMRFANPAAIAALGYDDADELYGRSCHEAVHHSHPDGSRYPAAECPMRLPNETGETVRSELDWFFRRDGSIFPVSYVSAPIELRDGRGAVVAFADIEARLHAERAQREHDALLESRDAALRRIAVLVAGGASSPEVFAAIAREVAHVLDLGLVVIWRVHPGEPAASVVGAWGDRPHPFQTGTIWGVEDQTAEALLPDIGRPARVEDFSAVHGAIPDALTSAGIRSGSGAAIIVDGEFWGTMGAGVAETESLPDHIEDRLAEFTDLLATAISNTEARQELAASRARIMAATDDERRRVVRDLHDGAQQRLIHTIITLKLARRALENEQETEVPTLLSEALDHAQQATAELRELAHGILPAVLIQGGLRAGVGALASRMPVPVENRVAAGRLPPSVEASAYFVVAEALTNVAKHARAERAEVTAEIEDGTLRVQVRDDGAGGARPGGSGLVGLADRLAVLGGRLHVESPPGGGTLLVADIPLPG